MYALIATLDETVDTQIQLLWKQLFELGLSDYGYEVANRQPHLTLADFSTDDVTTVITALDDSLRMIEPLGLSWSSIGSFLGSQIVFLSPVKTPELVALHKQVHKILSDCVSKTSPYRPDVWVPHVTIANRIAQDNLILVYSHCMDHLWQMDGEITAIKLIDIDAKNQVRDVHQWKIKRNQL